MSSQKLIGISVRPVDEILFNKAQNEAKRRGISFSRFICQLVRKEIEPWTSTSQRQELNETLGRPSTETERELDRVENGRGKKRRTNFDDVFGGRQATPTLAEIQKKIDERNKG